MPSATSAGKGPEPSRRKNKSHRAGHAGRHPSTADHSKSSGETKGGASDPESSADRERWPYETGPRLRGRFWARRSYGWPAADPGASRAPYPDSTRHHSGSEETHWAMSDGYNLPPERPRAAVSRSISPDSSEGRPHQQRQKFIVVCNACGKKVRHKSSANATLKIAAS